MSYQRDRIRQNRVVNPDTDHRVALTGLSFNGDPVLALSGIDEVTYVATLPDATIYQTGAAVYGLIDSDRSAQSGWYFYLRVPTHQTTIFIAWSVRVQAAVRTWSEQIDVLTPVLADTTVMVAGDGVVV